MIRERLAIVAVTWRPTFVVHKAIPAKLFCTFQMGVRKVPPTNKICCLLFLLVQLSLQMQLKNTPEVCESLHEVPEYH